MDISCGESYVMNPQETRVAYEPPLRSADIPNRLLPSVRFGQDRHNLLLRESALLHLF